MKVTGLVLPLFLLSAVVLGSGWDNTTNLGGLGPVTADSVITNKIKTASGAAVSGTISNATSAAKSDSLKSRAGYLHGNSFLRNDVDTAGWLRTDSTYALKYKAYGNTDSASWDKFNYQIGYNNQNHNSEATYSYLFGWANYIRAYGGSPEEVNLSFAFGSGDTLDYPNCFAFGSNCVPGYIATMQIYDSTDTEKGKVGILRRRPTHAFEVNGGAMAETLIVVKQMTVGAGSAITKIVKGNAKFTTQLLADTNLISGVSATAVVVATGRGGTVAWVHGVSTRPVTDTLFLYVNAEDTVNARVNGVDYQIMK